MNDELKELDFGKIWLNFNEAEDTGLLYSYLAEIPPNSNQLWIDRMQTDSNEVDQCLVLALGING